jgi:hypothetical protein
MRRSDGLLGGPRLDYEASMGSLRSMGGRHNLKGVEPVGGRKHQPLSEIAYARGFRDYTYVARKFRQRFGCAPGAHGRQRGRANSALRCSPWCVTGSRHPAATDLGSLADGGGAGSELKSRRTCHSRRSMPGR